MDNKKIPLNNNSEKQENKQLNIEIADHIADGTYSNLAVITHSHSEFVVDFISVMPNTPKCNVKARIILTPAHAKRLAGALIDNIEKYEKVHGEIKDPAQSEIPLNFGGPIAQA